MNVKQLSFFATKNDLIQLTEKLESILTIKYVEMGIFDEYRVNAYDSLRNIPNIGFTNSLGSPTTDHRYMIVLLEKKIEIRIIPQRRGGEKYSIDPKENDFCVEFSPAGIVLGQNGIIVLGRMGIVSNNPTANEIFHILSSELKSKFRKMGWAYVGKEAETHLQNGWRLVRDARLPKEHDLIP